MWYDIRDQHGQIEFVKCFIGEVLGLVGEKNKSVNLIDFLWKWEKLTDS
jgi:hypothetical protein